MMSCTYNKDLLDVRISCWQKTAKNVCALLSALAQHIDSLFTDRTDTFSALQGKYQRLKIPTCPIIAAIRMMWRCFSQLEVWSYTIRALEGFTWWWVPGTAFSQQPRGTDATRSTQWALGLWMLGGLHGSRWVCERLCVEIMFYCLSAVTPETWSREASSFIVT